PHEPHPPPTTSPDTGAGPSAVATRLRKPSAEFGPTEWVQQCPARPWAAQARRPHGNSPYLAAASSTTSTTRNPMNGCFWFGGSAFLYALRHVTAWFRHDPPRSTRYVPDSGPCGDERGDRA